MDTYVLHSNLHDIKMDVVGIILGYRWMDSTGIVNINVQKKFMKLWYKKNIITLHDSFLLNTKGPRGDLKKSLQGY